MPNEAASLGTADITKNPNIEEISQEKAAEVLEQIDKESSFRKFDNFWAQAVKIIAIFMSVYHLVVASGVFFPTQQDRQSVHLTFLLILAFLLYPAFGKKKDSGEGEKHFKTPRNMQGIAAFWTRLTHVPWKSGPSIFDLVWLGFSVMSSLYIFFYFEEFIVRATPIPRDIWMGVILIICVLEATRRAVGKELMILSIVFLAYGFLGHYLPDFMGEIAHRGFTLRRIIWQTYLSSEGIFGIALDISSTYIFLFVLFGAFLAETGMGGFIKDFAMCLAGRTIGGEAKVAIVTCGLMGMINGSAVGNVAATGTFTIPMMRMAGFKPVFSAALVAAAGTGGMIMPPVMGAASFIMAEYLQMHYSLIMLAAAIPAILYYFSQYVYVHVEARKLGMTRVPSEKITPMTTVLKRQGYMVVPITVIVYLLVIGRTPLYAAFYGIVSSLSVSLVVSLWQRRLLTALKSYVKALEQGARQSVSVGVACAVVGIINSITNLTGLGFTLGNAIVSLGAATFAPVFFTALFTTVLSIILGMGLPTTACYIITATIAAPPLIKMGVNPLAAHMFVYYFACLSNLTPPVAIASYGAAGLSGQNPSEVGWAGFRIALAGFVIPFTFIYAPALLFVGDILSIIQATITATIGVVAAALAMQSYMLAPLNTPLRLWLFLGAFCLIFPGLLSDITGLGIVGSVWAYQKFILLRRPS